MSITRASAITVPKVLPISQKRIGDSDLAVSQLCLGTMTFGEGSSYSEATDQLNLATEYGINFFDSAEMYPVPQAAHTQGKSESFLGKWIKQRQIPRDKVIISTKVAGPSGQMEWIRGGPHRVDAGNISAAIEGSLQRLQTDYIDLYQIHWPDRYVPMFGDTDYIPSMAYDSEPIENQLEALAVAVQQGKIRYIGLSNETPWGLLQFCQLSHSKPHLPKVVSIQNSYSLLCRSFDSALAECCHREGISLLGYSPLAMGLLTAKYYSQGGPGGNARLVKYRGRYAEAECRYPVNNPRVKAAVMEYAQIALRFGISPAVLAIAFAARNPAMASVVTGASSIEQLRELLEGIRFNVTDEMLCLVDSVHAKYPNPTP